MNHRNHSPNVVLEFSAVFLALFFAVIIAFTGCSSTHPAKAPAAKPTATAATNAPASSETLKLREGDSLKLSFPGAPNLNTSVSIRRDGKISPPLVGEVEAAGLTPPELEAKLKELYKPQLLTGDVNVEVLSSTFPVFVTGAVIRPGKLLLDHPTTAVEAIMEAGGPDYNKANLKGVRVTRNINGEVQHFTLNLKAVLTGSSTKVFYLKPSDIIYVPEKFSFY